ncbi:hypothetical protein BDZ91DRAFT_741789, partial [Kalaharituber pfeilii]
RLSCASDFGPGPLDPHCVCETSLYAQPPYTHNPWYTHQLLTHLDLKSAANHVIDLVHLKPRYHVRNSLVLIVRTRWV